MKPASRLLAFVALGASILSSCREDKPAPVADAAPLASASQDAATSDAPPVPITKWDPDARARAIAAGKSVLDKHECTRCHTIDDVAAASRPLACVSCHQFMHGLAPGDKAYESLVAKWGKDVLDRYQRNIVHLQRVPDLTMIARRVRGDYLARVLAQPFDQRPLLDESMIRHALSDDEIKSVVRYFVARAEAPDPYAPGYAAPALPAKPDDARLARGKELVKAKGCAACHTLGNVDLGVTRAQLEASRVTAALAPNLRFVRERTRPDAFVAWVRSPSSILPGTSMPAMGLTVDEAEAVRDYVYSADAELKPAPVPPAIQPPAILSRSVSYAEMKERVLGKVCVHCHMNDYEKDTGPGNKGGLGYAGVGLRMRTYETLVQGAVGPDGKRYGVLVPRKGESIPPIVRVMLERRIEGQRDHVAPFEDYARPDYPHTRPAMPMGLPSMTDEQIALLATWIAQGCKGPTEVSGKPGVGDGYLVPDGPIAHDRGCELRGPESPRPKWAFDAK